jgi:hypothetical protein
MGRLQSVVNTQRLRDAEALLLVLLLLLHLLLELLHLPQVHLCAASVIFIYIATVQIARSQDVPLLKQSDCAQVRNSRVLQQFCQLGVTKSCFTQLSVESGSVQPFQC